MAGAKAALDDHDIVFLHFKGTDTTAHDHRPDQKRAFIERIDGALEPLLSEDVVIGVTGDHSTDSTTGRHSGGPVPALLAAPSGRYDHSKEFSEREAMSGGLGQLSSSSFLRSMLDHMNRTQIYRPADEKYLI